MRLVATCLILSALISTGASASTIHVPGDQLTIQAGVDAAVGGDTVLVAPGLYVGAGNKDINLLGKGITVMSAQGPLVTVIDGEGAGRAFILQNGEDSTCILQGFTMRNCVTGNFSHGGAIIGVGSPPIKAVIRGNIITGCRAGRGGAALFQDGAAPTIVNNTIIGNQAVTTVNGGLQTDGGTILNNIIRGNVPAENLAGGSVVMYNNVESGPIGDGNIDVDPEFVNAAAGDYRLLSSSPCIDAGDPASPLDSDGTRADMGAVPYFQYGPVIHVSTLGSDSLGDGSESNPLATIQRGIDVAADGDTVLVAPGSYAEHISFGGKAIVVTSTHGPDSSVIRRIVPGLSLAVFNSGEDSSSLLEGFRFTEAEGGLQGGAIHCSNGSSPTIRNNVFINNASASVIYSIHSSPKIQYNVIARNGGNGLNIQDNAQIENNTIVLNNNVGAFLYSGSSALLRNNVVVYNRHGIYKTAVGATPTLSFNDVYANLENDYYGVVPDTGSISESPLFCDTALNRFTLAANSPCLGSGFAGLNLGALDSGCTVASPEQPVIELLSVGLPGDPMHITVQNPLISWRYVDPQERIQTMAEVECGSDGDWTVAEMWQPGIHVGSDTAVSYSGLPLLDGQTYYCRARVFNDTLWSNWTVAPFRMNTEPGAPQTFSPMNDTVIGTLSPSIWLQNAIDAEDDDLRYDFEVHADSGWGTILTYGSGILEGTGQTVWNSDPLPDNSRVWWRARANDGYENGPWSAGASFWVDGVPEPPSAVDLISPVDGGSADPAGPELVWHAAVDPDPFDTVTYRLQVGLDSAFTFYATYDDLADTSYQYPDSLTFGSDYYWRVFAFDTRSADSSESPTYMFFAGLPGDVTGDGSVSSADIIFLVNHVFKGGPAPVPAATGDVNGDCQLTSADIIYLVNHAFKGGPSPVAGCA